MIHPGDVIDKYAPDAVIGVLGAGGPAPAAAVAAAPGAAAAAPAAGGAQGYTLDEVAKHTTKEDCWVVVNGQVLNVTKFLPDHPGGELAILTFAGKDATAEFNMIHPPDVIGKYAPDAVIGVLSEGASDAAPAATGGAGAPLLDKPAAPAEAGALSSLASAIYIPGDRASLTRSAFFLIFFIVVHAIGNLHVFLGPDDFNGYGFFYVRLYWTGFGLNANIVEEYVAFAAVLHVVVALKRTYDINLGYSVSSGKLNLAISGVLLLIYMTIHLFQFRFGLTQPYWVRPPPYLINIWELPHLFWTSDPSIALVPVRDIYKLEFDLFQDTTMVLYYVCMVFVFFGHYCWGWAKVVPSSQLGIPKKYHWHVIMMGYAIGVFLLLCYTAFPLFCVFVGPSKGGTDQPAGYIGY
jgi:hypothetical protein